MDVLKSIVCLNCGGEKVKIAANGTYAVCEYCKRRYEIISTLNDGALIAFAQATEYWKTFRFADAKRKFLEVTNDNPEFSEAWWGAFISEYGIEFGQNSPGEKVPTCHRAHTVEVSKNESYLKAVETADEENKKEYIALGNEIERIRAEIIKKSEDGKSYDVFICFKATEINDPKKKTDDYYLGKDIYYELKRDGYNVFFSAETLAHIGEQEFEPYIFKALSTAKVMLVLCSDNEKIESAWVKNEWGRFLDMRGGKGLIPVCGNNGVEYSPYNLPEELRKLNAIEYDGKLFEKLKTKIEAYFPERVKARKEAERKAREAEYEAKFAKEREEQAALLKKQQVELEAERKAQEKLLKKQQEEFDEKIKKVSRYSRESNASKSTAAKAVSVIMLLLLMIAVIFVLYFVLKNDAAEDEPPSSSSEEQGYPKSDSATDETGNSNSYSGSSGTQEQPSSNSGAQTYPKNDNATNNTGNNLYSGGSGTQEDPFLISNATDFVNIEKNMTACFKLTNDIDIGDKWTPLGLNNWVHSKIETDFDGAFRGVLDGNGKTIIFTTAINTVLEENDYAWGLFGVLENATICNLTISCTVSNKDLDAFEMSVGGISGIAVNSTFENCTVTANSVINNDWTDRTYYKALQGMYYTGATYAGGLVGDARNCTFISCVNKATVTAKGYSAYSGGIAGNAYQCTITSCINSGSVSSSHGAWIWGLHNSGGKYGKNNGYWQRSDNSDITK